MNNGNHMYCVAESLPILGDKGAIFIFVYILEIDMFSIIMKTLQHRSSGIFVGWVTCARNIGKEFRK